MTQTPIAKSLALQTHANLPKGLSLAGGNAAMANALHLPPFHPRFPWIGPDLQTVRNKIRKAPLTLDGSLGETLTAPLSDQGAGQLILAVDHPAPGPGGKLVLLFHGLGGSSDSNYMVETAKHFLDIGVSVVRANMRGSGLSRETAPAPYSGGLTCDIRAAMKAIPKEWRAKGFYAMGYSLGGQMLLRTLGEGDMPVTPDAAVTVSAPLDLAAANRCLFKPRNRPYQKYLVETMNEDLSHLLPDFKSNPPKSVNDYDERLIAPFMGFDSAAAYYEGVSCFPLLDKIRVPLLSIHAKNDPWISWHDYFRANWSDRSVAILTKSGGHVGFHASGFFTPWNNIAAGRFLARFG